MSRRRREREVQAAREEERTWRGREYRRQHGRTFGPITPAAPAGVSVPTVIIGHRYTKTGAVNQYQSLQNDISLVEANVSLPLCAMTATRMFVRVWAYSMVDAGALPIPCVYTLMRNGVGTVLSVSVVAVGTFSVTANVVFNDSDTFSIEIDPRVDYSAGTSTAQVVLCFQ